MEKYPHIDRTAHLRDLELCKRYIEGDRQPFEAMFQIAYGKLERYIKYDSCGKHLDVHINAQDKEDLISDVTGTVISNLRMFHGWSLLSTWMIAIARYRIINLIKKRCRDKKNLTDNEFDDSRLISPLHLQNDDTAVLEILSCLLEPDAAIVRLKAVERLAFSKIAEELGLSTKQVQHRYKKAIEMLRCSIK